MSFVIKKGKPDICQEVTCSYCESVVGFTEKDTSYEAVVVDYNENRIGDKIPSKVYYKVLSCPCCGQKIILE